MVQVLAGSTLFQRISKKSTAVRWGAKAVSPCVIAVMGIGGSVGTTHLCMMLANSMANGLKVRTAFVEYGVHDTAVPVCIWHKKQKVFRVTFTHFNMQELIFTGVFRKKNL